MLTVTRSLREGSALKRAAVLGAARELFATEGFERTSMDAVALRAQVSKRTVYDYFGDKRTLLLAVIEDVAQSLLDAIRLAIQAHLSDDAGIDDPASLEAGLVGFATQISSSTIGSSDYAALMKLLTTEGAGLSELRDHPLFSAPEDAMAERFAHFTLVGLLDAPDARLAADHFNALAFLLVQNNQGALSSSGAIDVRQTIADGVHAFMRAYTPR